ncbi:MAG: NAD(P)/FAD-dependent oxidoreductase [Clostridia bacterium]|nr:NAD(P)/FAD-dependent oxidoreductase [Clostridia bacterium]
MKTIIIGGGPAGMIAAIASAKQGNETILLEQNKTLGKKLLITGKGRCNITSSLDMDEFIHNIPGNGRFLYSAFQKFTNQDIIDLLNENGLEVKTERGNRIFPITDRAVDVLNCLIDELKKNNVKIKTNSKVSKILVEDNKVIGIEVENSEKISCDKIILATGGKSYPITGSNGNGYNLAKKLGHTITEIKPSIVPLKAEEYLCQSMQGLSLKNVKITIKDEEKNKKIYDDFGEMLFTHFGVSGPTILSSSAHLVRYKNIEDLFKNNKIKLIIDLKPALSEDELDLRIIRDWNELKNKEFKNSLDKLLPQKMIKTIIELTNIPESKRVNEITKEERLNLVKTIKSLTINIKGFRPIEEAIVTAGGISIKEINPKTMESKIVKGLYFAGEIIDVDAYTGGFNLQIAYSTGYTAGTSF